MVSAHANLKLMMEAMSNDIHWEMNSDQLMTYQIKVKGHLGRQWVDWFGGLTITLQDNGDTLLTGPVVDQAALYGLLKKVRDLGMPLLSLNQVDHVEPGQADVSDHYRSKKEINR